MKRIITTIIVLFTVFSLQAQSQKIPEATVEKVLNVPIFLYSYPDSNYQEVGTVDALGSAIVDVLGEESTSVRDKIFELVQTAKRKHKKGKLPDFDALIVNPDNYSAIVIKFTGKKSLLAQVHKVLNVPVYLYSYPNTDYEEQDQVQTIFADTKFSNNVLALIEKAKRREKRGKISKFDAIIISPDDVIGILIKFK